MGTGNDYAELCDLQPPGRWNSRGYQPSSSTNSSSIYHQSASTGVGGHLKSSSFEAEDLIGPYESTRIGNSTSSLRPKSGLYYSPPGTSYTIVERERSHSPHYYYNTAGIPSKGGSLPNRSSFLESSILIDEAAGTVPSSTRHNTKKRPISPEQVLRLFSTTVSSPSVPTAYHHSSNGIRDRDRRSPASSPPSTTHQIYSRDRVRERSVPNIHNLSTRTVTMSRDQPDGNHGFGICVKGGKETGLGVYISRVEESSVAERAGLRPGDTILEVNGTPFTSINHEEALKRCVQILKSSRQISMTVRAPPSATSFYGQHPHPHVFGPSPIGRDRGLHQSSSISRQTCSWMDRNGRPASPPYEYGGRRPERRDRVRRVELLIEPGQSLGLMIRGGVEYGLGIFVTGVDKDSVADRAGLMVGDQILEVNGQSFLEVTHDEAVSQFKFHKRMSLLVRDVGKVPHSCTTVEPEIDVYGPSGSSSRRKCPISAMVEEKARSLLPRHHFANLSYYIVEYGARGMTIEAFVAVLLEMLDTPEKHSLVTEIRELVFPEDRSKYDELVYRKGGRDVSMEIDRHRRKVDSLIHSHELVSDTDLEVIAATGRSPSEDSGLGLTLPDIRNRPPAPLPLYRPLSAGPILHHHSSLRNINTSLNNLQLHPSSLQYNKTSATTSNPDKLKGYNTNDLRGRRGSETQLSRAHYDSDQGSYLDVVRGLTQRVKSWYWGRPLELATKLSRSFDMKDDGGGLLSDRDIKYQSMQRLPLETDGANIDPNKEQLPHIVPDNKGNLHVTVKKSKPILGIAIEGGANTKHPLPRIINIHEHGAAYEAGGLEVGQLILEVDGNKVDGMHHQDVARLIAECFAKRDKADISFLVVEAKKSNLEPKPTALIFLEA